MALLPSNTSRFSLVSGVAGWYCSVCLYLTEQERLPYAEGWRPPTTQTTLMTLGDMIVALNVANGEVISEGLEITTNTLKLAFGGYDPITGLLAHTL